MYCYSKNSLANTFSPFHQNGVTVELTINYAGEMYGEKGEKVILGYLS